jgi:hypothetical protein
VNDILDFEAHGLIIVSLLTLELDRAEAFGVQLAV